MDKDISIPQKLKAILSELLDYSAKLKVSEDVFYLWQQNR